MKSAEHGFWHLPETRVRAQWWHFYRKDGMSLCQRFTLLGYGTPKDATNRRPKNACADCKKKLDQI